MKPSTVKTLAVLMDGRWHSDYDLIERVRATQAGRRLRELRAQGYLIEKRRIRLNGRASHAYEYRLLGLPPPSVPVVPRPASLGDLQAAWPWAETDQPEPYGPP